MSTSSSWRRPLFAVLLVMSSGCSCDEDIINMPPTPEVCELDFECEMGRSYRNGACVADRCASDVDCCPGQACNMAAGFCADQLVSCTDSNDCEIADQECILHRDGMYCGYPNSTNGLSQYGTQACANNSDCSFDRSCFAQRCVKIAPCEGGCPENLVCDVDTNTCFDARPRANAEGETPPDNGCSQTCGEGQMLILADQDTMSGPVCCSLACECATLPPVLPGQYGWYADIAVSETEVLVSSYDPGYGDLVVSRFDDAGAPIGVEYVDGFPTSGPILGDPSGIRGGRAEPGMDVGSHTSIAIDGQGAVHVAYYDVDAGALKYAHHADGTWTSLVIDDEGDTGLYTSIAIGTDGNPRIAYMMGEGTDGGDPRVIAGLKYATASGSAPLDRASWSIQLVDSVVKPEPICGGGCPSAQECVDIGGGPSCQSTALGCTGCANDQACIDVMGTPTCQDTISVSEFDDLVEGTGLFASLAIDSSGVPHIAYYDRLAGDLRYAAGTPMNTFTLQTLDGDDMMDPTDVGLHPSIAIAPDGRIGIVYSDASNDALLYLEVGTPAREIIDTGISPPDIRVVGADASLLYDANGIAAVAYQDSTNIDLLYARRLGNPAMWSTEVLRGDPAPGADKGIASGFYTSQALRGSTAYISNLDVTFSPDSELLLDLSVVTKLLD